MDLWSYLPFLHGSFTDEHENVITSWLITQGYSLYSDLFTHHAPFPYIFGMVIAHFFGPSLLAFRIFTLILWIGLLAIIFRLKIIKHLWVLVGLLLLATPSFMLHMYLADTWGVFGFILLLAGVITKNQLTIGTGSFIAVWSSPVMLVPVAGLVLYSRWKRAFSWWIVLPHLLMMVGLWVTQTFSAFFFDVITYNREYYLPWRWQTNNLFTIALQSWQQIYLIPMMTFGAAVYRLILTLMHVGVRTTLIEVAWREFVHALHWPHLFLPTIGLVVLGRAIKKKSLLIAAIAILGLAIRNDEWFHLGALYAALCFLGVYLYRSWKAYLIITGWALVCFIPEWLPQPGMISNHLLQQTQTATSLPPLSRIMVIDSSPYLYYLSNTRPAVSAHYLFPWIIVVPHIQDEVTVALRENPPQAIIVGKPLPELEAEFEFVKTVLQSRYKDSGNGVFRLRE